MPLLDRFRHGGTEYPLTAETSNSLLQDADPALFFGLQLFVAALGKYAEPRFLSAAAIEGKNFPSIVETQLDYEPTPFLLTQDLKFPIFCMYRSEEEWTEDAKSFLRDESTWEWAFILPPLTPRQIKRLHPILRTVSVVIAQTARNSFDSSFEDGKTLRDLAGIQKMSPGRARYGSFERVSEQEQWWRALTGTIKVQERSDHVIEQLEPFKGANIHLDLATPQGTVTDLVVVHTPPDIELESIGPTSGSMAGGTALVVDMTTACLTPGAQYSVQIGDLFATGVVCTHPTRLVCTTPEVDYDDSPSAPPPFAVDVQVFGEGGQASNVLEQAFTYLPP